MLQEELNKEWKVILKELRKANYYYKILMFKVFFFNKKTKKYCLTNI